MEAYYQFFDLLNLTNLTSIINELENNLVLDVFSRPDGSKNTYVRIFTLTGEEKQLNVMNIINSGGSWDTIFENDSVVLAFGELINATQNFITFYVIIKDPILKECDDNIIEYTSILLLLGGYINTYSDLTIYTNDRFAKNLEKIPMDLITSTLIDPKGLEFINLQLNNPIITHLADIMSQLRKKKPKPSENDKIRLTKRQNFLLDQINFRALFVNYEIYNPKIKKNKHDNTISIIDPQRRLPLTGGKFRKTRKKRKTRRIKRKVRRTKFL
jgi:hypothetical protein